MKSLQNFALAVFLAALACTGLEAQTVDLRATIPFDFHAGDKLMSAGEYLIHEQDSCVILHRLDGDRPANIVLMTIGAGGRDPQDAHLDFNRYGSEYFLRTIWDSLSQNGRQVPQTARQKELARRGGAPAQATVALRKTN